MRPSNIHDAFLAIFQPYFVVIFTQCSDEVGEKTEHNERNHRYQPYPFKHSAMVYIETPAIGDS